MGFRDIFRRLSARPDQPQVQRNHIEPLPASATFQQLLSGAKGLDVYTGMDRDDPRFDENMGAIMADRIADSGKPDMTWILTAAVLLTHCSQIGAVRFITDLNKRGFGFGLSITDSGAIRAASSVSFLTATMDIYDIAADCAQRGDLPQNCGPFRGPAQVLWDAGFEGRSRIEAPVRHAYAELHRRVLHTWELESDGSLPGLED